ncbi:hypothetical protein BJ741DRAFT_614998 [Chytriomyces cf. hyalinus JEL632]|nr:hypothetical protein BJ741DRAFT_614998 [Chytriomyces cf. hyalinus JEL632]
MRAMEWNQGVGIYIQCLCLSSAGMGFRGCTFGAILDILRMGRDGRKASWIDCACSCSCFCWWWWLWMTGSSGMNSCCCCGLESVVVVVVVVFVVVADAVDVWVCSCW